MPVTLTPAERTAYEAEWGEFCREMDIARRGRNVARGRAALLRFRQKAGLIRVDSTVPSAYATCHGETWWSRWVRPVTCRPAMPE